MESIRREIYEEEMRPFLATVALAFACTNLPLVRDGILYFRIHSKHYTISIPQLGKALGFDYEDAIDFGPKEYGDIWQESGEVILAAGKPSPP